ncbi:MAG: DNA polymerase III subunit beta, partial [Acidimicrobiales bacterium]
MKLRCERDTLVEALTTAGRAVSGRGGQLPVLSGLYLVLAGDELVVTGSDLELTIARTLEVNGEVDGSAVVPAKLLIDVVRSLEPGAIELDLNELDLTIRGGRSEFSIRTIPTDEFPQLVSAEGPAVTIEAASFVAALRQVVPAASSDDSRPILTGVLLTPNEGGLRLVATDSYRLAVSDIPGASILEGDQSVLVPSR